MELYLRKINLNLIYRTRNEFEYHFSNIEQAPTYSFVVNQTRTPYFFASKERTSNLIGPSLDLLNYSSNRLEHRF